MKELLHDHELNTAIEKQKELVRDHEHELCTLKAQLEDLEEQLKSPDERAKKWLALQEMIWTNNFVVNYVRGLEKQVEELKAAKGNDQPERKPLWMVVHAEAEENEIYEKTNVGDFIRRVFSTKQGAEKFAQTVNFESPKVVPVWGE
jgi:hypothetical protein